MTKLWLSFINLSMLSEREEIAEKQSSIFCNRQLCAVIVEISIQEISQNEKK